MRHTNEDEPIMRGGQGRTVESLRASEVGAFIGLVGFAALLIIAVVAALVR